VPVHTHTQQKKGEKTSFSTLFSMEKNTFEVIIKKNKEIKKKKGDFIW
jgi:hypothetical protein